MKNLIYMNRMIFQYAKKEAIGYLLVDILVCIAASVQLWILQKLVDTFFRTEEIGAAGLMAVGLLGGYFLIMACLNFVKERLKFQLEKKITLNLGTGIVKTLNGLEYQCYEQEQLYNIIEKISDEPYKKFLEGFFCFSGMIGTLSQLLTVFVFIFLISGMGLAVNICLVLAIFYFDYRIMSVSDELDNDKISEERRLKYFLNLFFSKNELMEIRILQIENFFQGKIRELMKQVFRKRLKISLHTQKYYGCSCLLTAVWTVWLLVNTGINVYDGQVSAGAFLACIKMIDMVSSLSGAFSEEYVEFGEALQKITYMNKLEEMGKQNA